MRETAAVVRRFFGRVALHLVRFANVGRWALLLILPAAGGALFTHVSIQPDDLAWGYLQAVIVGVTLLVGAGHLVTRRREAFAVMVAWYLASLLPLIAVWHAFHGSWLGVLLWACLAPLLALPAFLAPKKHPALGIATASLVAAVPPFGLVGMTNPLLGAGALFPGAGWLGFGLMTVFLGLSFKGWRWAVIAQIACLGWGMVLLRAPLPDPPELAWALDTRFGGHQSATPGERFDRQDKVKARLRHDIADGARILVTPEGISDQWDEGQVIYWQDLAAFAGVQDAQVLVGAYTASMFRDVRSNGFVDLATGILYPARITAPGSLWVPFAEDDNFPLHLDALKPIPTRAGPAAYLICYEELLVWPLAFQMAAGDPAWLIAGASQWFATEWTGRPQARAVKLQARLWGLPHVRAVNY